MVEIVSWIGVAVIALLAAVGFAGVVATSVLTLVRRVRSRETVEETAPARGVARAA